MYISFRNIWKRWFCVNIIESLTRASNEYSLHNLHPIWHENIFGAMKHLYHVRMTHEILLHLTYEDMAVYSLYDVRTQKNMVSQCVSCHLNWYTWKLILYIPLDVYRISNYILWADNTPNNLFLLDSVVAITSNMHRIAFIQLFILKWVCFLRDHAMK